MGFVHPIVEIFNVDSFGPPKSCGGSLHVTHAYTLKKNSRTFIWDQYMSQHGGKH